MYVGRNSEMLVFSSVFFPNSSFDRQFSTVAREKTEKMLLFMEYVCMYVRPKLTFVSFFLFFMHLPLIDILELKFMQAWYY